VLSGKAESFELEYACGQPSDSQSWFRLMVTPLKGSRRESAVVMHVDITDLVRAKEASRRLAAILEATPEFVGLCDTEGNLIYVNRSGRELVGISPDDGEVMLGHASRLHPSW